MTTQPAERSDAALVSSVAAGDAQALAALYDRHADVIYRAAYRRLGDSQLAEEVLQDTYLALWNRAELYDERQGSLLAWLGTIARNRAIDRLRAAGRRPLGVPLSALLVDDSQDDRALDRAMSSGGLLGSGPPPLDPEEHMDAAELRAEVQVALARIPQLERQVLELAYFEDLTQSEIAIRLSWPLGTVKTRTRRGLLRLRALLVTVLGADIAPPESLLTDMDDAAPPDPIRQAAGATDGPR
jgi:RNA polymerase sigma-70 factor (ECF subfamily)